MVELVLGSVVSLWLLFGLVTGIILAVIVLVGVLFSRDLNRGITTTISEVILSGLGDKKDVFLANLEKELKRRGLIPRVPLAKEADLIYRDFFNEVRIYAVQEGTALRFGYRISATSIAVTLGVILLIPFVVGSVVLFALAILRRNNTQMTLREAGQSAELLTRET
ncbi:MAG: hypothetical protein OK441_00135 [Thaumarchaeota archaeon]|nr:hypothetical protein [Nitrososphaerota archaeon]